MKNAFIIAFKDGVRTDFASDYSDCYLKTLHIKMMCFFLDFDYLQSQFSDQLYLCIPEIESPNAVSKFNVELLMSFNSSPHVSLTLTGLMYGVKSVLALTLSGSVALIYPCTLYVKLVVESKLICPLLFNE